MKRWSWIFLLLSIGIGAIPASAQNVGVRAGLSLDPEQFYFGVHGTTPPIVDALEFRPNLEIGFGDSRTIVALNGEFVYPFELNNRTPLYAGGGPALVIIRRDQTGAPGGSVTNVEPGFNFLLGLVFAEDYFTEIKIGVIDSPEVKFGVGYNF